MGGALINLLRQLGKLHANSKQISVGFIGYPNTGKSSVINALRSKKVCNVAPIAGETKVWQYITLMRKIYLIDCPGIVPPGQETDEEKVLRGVVRVELVETPDDYIPAVLERSKQKYIERTYRVKNWTSPTDFLEKLAKRSGKLLKGGEPDLKSVAKTVLNDWQRGKLPYFVPPPGCNLEPKPEGDDDDDDDEDEEEEEEEEEVVESEDEEAAYESEDDDISVCTNDTSATTDTTTSVDSLHETINKFQDEEEEEGEEVFKKPLPMPENLQDLVKQDFRKIVQSVEYFDEEKYEKGRKRKSKKITTKEAPKPEAETTEKPSDVENPTEAETKEKGSAEDKSESTSEEKPEKSSTLKAGKSKKRKRNSIENKSKAGFEVVKSKENPKVLSKKRKRESLEAQYRAATAAVSASKSPKTTPSKSGKGKSSRPKDKKVKKTKIGTFTISES